MSIPPNQQTLEPDGDSHSKWISGLSPKDRLLEAAHASLKQRFDAVAFYLELSEVCGREDTEPVHQLRVFTRRSHAALDLYRSMLSRKWYDEMVRHLTEIRRAAGRARDLDVILLRFSEDTDPLEASRFQKQLRRKRDQADIPIHEIFREFAVSGKLRKRTNRLLKSLVLPAQLHETTFQQFAAKEMKRVTRRFWRCAEVDASSWSQLHRLRIQAKKLRYAMELLASAFPVTFRTELYPAIAELQSRLGEVNDSVVLVKRLKRLRHKAKRNKVRREYTRIIQAEKSRREQSLQAVTQWWTSERIAQVRRDFKSCLRQAGT